MMRAKVWILSLFCARRYEMTVSVPTKRAASSAPCAVRGRFAWAIWRRGAGMSVQTMFCHKDRSAEGAKANRSRIAVHVPPAMPSFFAVSGVVSSVVRRWRPYAPRAHSAKAEEEGDHAGGAQYADAGDEVVQRSLCKGVWGPSE